MHKDIIIPNRVCSLGLGLSLGLGGKQTSAAGGGGGGGGGFTPFTDDFTNLDAWSTTGNIALASGRLRVSNGFSSGTGSGYVTGYEMTEAEGSYDLTALMYYSEEFNHQIGFLMDDTLAAKPSFINSTLTGNGYAMWFSSGAVTLHSVVGSQSILKTWFPLIGSGDRLGVRIVFNGDGDMSVTPLHNGSVVSGGSHDIAAASLLANRGSRLGLCGFAAASYTTEFDDVSYDVTPAAPPSGMVGWLKLDDATVGAFPTVANAGSFSCNWTRNGSKVTLASGGPNGMKYAAIDDAAGDDWVHIATTGTIANLLGTGSYMYGVIFRADTEASSGAQYLGKNLIYDEAGYGEVGLRSAAADKVAAWMWDTAEKAIKLDYTSDTWRALVVRYDADGDTLYAKINGGTWQSLGSVGSFGVTSGVLRLLSRGTGGADADVAEFLTYQSQSEANGDTLMTYLVERAGL